MVSTNNRRNSRERLSKPLTLLTPLFFVACGGGGYNSGGGMTAPPPPTVMLSVQPMTVTAGQSYYLIVDGFSGASGNFALTVSPPG